MKVITAQNFIKYWLSFSNEKILRNPDWRNAWENSSTWSKLILGTKTSSNTDSPIGNYFRGKYPTLKYRTEDGLFDLSFTVHNHITEIPTLDDNYEIITFENKDYARIYDVLIEHENEIYDSWHEIAKLAYVRSLLKVVVTYNSDGITSGQLQKEIQMMTERFEKIIPQCNKDFPDNIDTEYVLLIGNKTADTLEWTYRIFDWNGAQKHGR